MTMPANYFDRFDPAKNYERQLFIAGRPMQSAEWNDLQRSAAYSLKGVADALFKDGDIIRDARVQVDPETGAVTCDSGAIYLRGLVRGVPSRNFTIATSGVVTIGVYLVESIVTALEDPALLNPATGTKNYNMPGAERLRVDPQWGYEGDGTVGEFYAVYEVIDGILSSKEPPPNLDAVTQALARYDRDSTGGTYVVSGMTVTWLNDKPTGEQVFTISEGRARVNGYGIEYISARRAVIVTEADLRLISNEPKTSTTAGSQRINVDRPPLKNITSVSITKQKTVTLTHGVTVGSQDPLPDTSVLEIVEVNQGATVYSETSDYLLTAGKVDWSPAGNEPAPGSSYTVKYKYIAEVTPTAVDETGFSITGAVVGTLVLTTYNQMLPRIDRLCLDASGMPIFLKGVAADYSPQPPTVPGDMLSLATIYQNWTAARYMRNDSVRMVSMPILSGIENRLDRAMQLIAQQRLESDIHMREAGTKKGVFVDPFLDDSQRDAGISQTAAVVFGELTLPISAQILSPDSDIASPQVCSHTLVTALEQRLRTGAMKINPYMAFQVPAAQVRLSPAVDRWTLTESDWTGPITQRFVVGQGDMSSESSSTADVLLSSTASAIETLRPIEVRFSISGFGPGEELEAMTFDGVEVTPTAI